MAVLKIKEAIKSFNDNRKDGEAKLTQAELGKHVLPKLSDAQAGWYISRWVKGKDLGKLGPTEILLISITTGVTLNFLFGIEE